MAKRDVPLAELGNWIEAKTEGEYRLVKQLVAPRDSSNLSQLRYET